MRNRAVRAALVVLAVAVGLASATIGPATADDGGPTRESSCLTLYLTQPLTWRNPESGATAAATPAVVARLPRTLVLRSGQETFNRRYDYAVRDGDLYFRTRKRGQTAAGPWGQVVVPRCFGGRIASIDADRDWLLVVTDDRQVFGTSHADGGPERFDWSMRWGPILGFGERLDLPADTVDWSVSSTTGAYRFYDATGGLRPTAGAGTLYELRAGGQRITYDDPWLPTDGSYELCGPENGRLRAAGIASGGATVMVIGEHGELYTRSYDFDLSGANTLLLRYGWGDATPADAIRLPRAGWRRQPPIDRPLTSAISVVVTGLDEPQRLLRVEGRNRAGRTGVWQKRIDAPRWNWVRTDEPLRGRPLSDDRTPAALAAPAVAAYRGRIGEVTAEVPDFSVACSPATLRLRAPSGATVELPLHLTEAIRQATRGPGLDATPRGYLGQIEVPPALAARREALDPALRALLDGPLGGRRYSAAPLVVTADALRLPKQCWALGRDGAPVPPRTLQQLVDQLLDLGTPVNLLTGRDDHAAPTPLSGC
ncbi:hypothetical protein [Patulibacter defluvii]|uniref:hypothetical protein n=1 Tax=Patulibacter defluvii TaxID=3095358 RepID=UPI002A75F056|nr:hypothetical protein [Patulibacter sp. DM4]